MDARVLEDVTDAALHMASQEHAAPAVVRLLIGRYADTGRDDLRDAAGLALAGTLETAERLSAPGERAEALALFAAAAALSDDERLREWCGRLADALRHEWPGRGSVATAMASIDAVLVASATLAERGDPNGRIAAAIDEMERVIGLVYAPGQGIRHDIGAAPDPGTLADHAGAAAALLTAHALTGRLPYGMLAEELTQSARRQWWEGRADAWQAQPFGDVCAAAHVLCGLARLHGDSGYRDAAVTAGTDYAAEAEAALATLEPRWRGAGAEAAAFGLALMELFALSPGPNLQ